MTPPATERFDSIKLTLVTLILAFSLTLVFRGFIAEAFIIPTGSMAPTLLGEHWRAVSPASGESWAISSRVIPPEGEALRASDPLTRAPLALTSAGRRAGDRIFALKWAYALRDPGRWDAVIFKNPESPRENYIKRVVGLPGEEVWIVDGDVFVREATDRRSDDAPKRDDGWRIARKPERVQRALWQPVWSSEHAWAEGLVRSATDPDAEADAGILPPPWTGAGWRWTSAGRSLRFDGKGEATLTWDSERWPINDWTPYNEPLAPIAGTRGAARRYPVSDVRVRFAVEQGFGDLSIRLAAQGAAWLVRVSNHGSAGGAWIQQVNPDPAAAEPERREWPDGQSPMSRWPVMVDVRLIDQSVQLWLDGRLVVERAMDLAPRERLGRATGFGAARIDAMLLADDPDARANPFADPALYAPPEISIEFGAGPITLHRLGVERDIYYRPGVMESDPSRPMRGTHPTHGARLSADEFFVLGDNSAASRDSRLWDTVNPWVAAQIDPAPGVVHRAMLLGKAFFVYFPAPHEVVIAGERRPIVPDFGRMRWIR